MADIKQLPIRKPASRPEVIEFLRELILTAYEEPIENILYVLWGEHGRETHGILSPGTTFRDAERAVDFMDAWVADLDLDDEYGQDDEGDL
jgi:hypothetical protein